MFYIPHYQIYNSKSSDEDAQTRLRRVLIGRRTIKHGNKTVKVKILRVQITPASAKTLQAVVCTGVFVYIIWSVCFVTLDTLSSRRMTLFFCIKICVM